MSDIHLYNFTLFYRIYLFIIFLVLEAFFPELFFLLIMGFILIEIIGLICRKSYNVSLDDFIL